MDRASRKKSRGMEPYAPPPAAGAPPSGRTGGRGSVGLGPVHGLVHVEGVDLQAVYLGGRAVLLKDGTLVADGAVASTITEDQVRRLYELPPRAEAWMRLTGTSAP